MRAQSCLCVLAINALAAPPAKAIKKAAPDLIKMAAAALMDFSGPSHHP
jgi:hypothetical protein